MTVWAFARLSHDFVNDLVGRPYFTDMIGSLGFGALVALCERHNFVDQQTSLLVDFASKIGGAGPAAIHSAAFRLSVSGNTDAALAFLRSACLDGNANANSEQIFAALSGTGLVQNRIRQEPGIDAQKDAMPELQGSKAALLLPFVLSRAEFGNPSAVCKAIEDFAVEILRPSRKWLKIAGGSKVETITTALDAAPEGTGVFLEIGTYFGYSALQIAMANPGRRIITIEVDLVNAVVAQCLIMHAGLAHVIDVWNGHSQDVLPSICERAESQFFIAGLFMDQCGSRFWEDLQTVMDLGILLPGAVIVADNVLKPGAPVFLWHLFFSGAFRNSRVISLDEFGMPGVEDWIAVGTFMGEYHPGMIECSNDLECELEDLEWEANRIRAKAAGPGGVPFEDWKAFSAQMRYRLG
eukprot:CAMPEP_0169252716 /NCGR_PEP_ID=MMETSP1016-20121227/38203_1 /TAXON_ID=342587 /ORGANISM="Karlodinium micrum, Strain CCMP2283" /LENGTH=409 /DNA_ID=CAMNT_0009333955 /DNA_START=56 /DNA_END=1282 /DNA_ORIENTATION=-